MADPHAEKVTLAEDLIAAVKAGDADAVATIYEEMYEVCAAAKSGEYEEPTSEAGPMDLTAVLGKG